MIKVSEIVVGRGEVETTMVDEVRGTGDVETLEAVLAANEVEARFRGLGFPKRVDEERVESVTSHVACLRARRLNEALIFLHSFIDSVSSLRFLLAIEGEGMLD